MPEQRGHEVDRGPQSIETVAHLEYRRALEARLAGTTDRATLAAHLARGRTQREVARRYDPRADVAQRPVPAGRHPYLITDRGDVIRLERVRRPAGPPAFAAVDPCVEVAGKGPMSGLLRIPLGADSARGLVPESLRLARWDEGAGRFFVLPGSFVGAGHVEGRITRAGTYAVAGLPDDPRVLATIDLMRTIGGWLGPVGPELVPKICGLILCAEPGIGAGAPGDLCDICLGGAGGGIDLDLFGALEHPPGYVPPRGVVPVPRCETWESVGPTNVPGRTTTLVPHPTDSRTLYVGSAAGGVFKTSDAGATWAPLWRDQLSLAIGGLAICGGTPAVLYAATGEWAGIYANPNNHFAGVGVYRTSDGGSSWDLLAPIASTETSAAAVDPTDADRAYVAGNLALHRTRDGGRTWDVTAGCTWGVFDGVITDVVVDPEEPLRLYVAVHNDGIWRSTDGGNTWTRLTNGIDTGAAAVAPRIALGRSGAHRTKFVAVLMDHRVYTSVDGGTTFTRKTDVAQTTTGGSDPTWCACIAVDPTDEGVLIAGHVYLARSTDGGASWTVIGCGWRPNTTQDTNVHCDMQAVCFDPTAHDRVFAATDGGVSISNDNGRTWDHSDIGLVTSQCWTVRASADRTTPRLAITTQDQACYRSSSGSLVFDTILNFEGGVVEWDEIDALVLYANTGFDYLKRSSDAGTTWTVIEPRPLLTVELATSYQDPLLVLAIKTPSGVYPPAVSSLERSADRGTTWSVAIAASVAIPSAVAFAPSDSHSAYVGALSAGIYRVYRSSDAGQTWTALSATGLPAAFIRRIVVDWHDPKRFYVAFGTLGIRHVWRGDIGATANAVTWTDVTGRVAATSLPDLAITGVALHPTVDDTIYVSNILGVYRSLDGGDSWTPFDEDLPNCFVSDLDIRMTGVGPVLYASTMGRGIYRRKL